MIGEFNLPIQTVVKTVLDGLNLLRVQDKVLAVVKKVNRNVLRLLDWAIWGEVWSALVLRSAEICGVYHDLVNSLLIYSFTVSNVLWLLFIGLSNQG